MEIANSAQIAGLILAGGKSSRMGGGDKALVKLMGESLLERTIARVRPQVGRLLLSANGDPARFQSFGLPVLPDPVGDHWGPLAGILAGLDYLAEHRPEMAWLASFPTDSPFLPTDLVEELSAALAHQGGEIAMAESGGTLQPVFALWPVSLRGNLRAALLSGVRKVEQFATAYRLARVAWPDEAFFNINSPEDLHLAARRL
jgi:molybdopterin-guanine dinucleotide biosynthesis protein A